MPAKKRFRYRRLLKKKEMELLQVLGMRDGVTAAERMPDVMDEVLSSYDRDLVIDSLVRHADLLKQVRCALDSLDSGDYGLCSSCGEPIPERRLEALPWAIMCLPCQEVADRDSERPEAEEKLGRALWAA